MGYGVGCNNSRLTLGYARYVRNLRLLVFISNLCDCIVKHLPCEGTDAVAEVVVNSEHIRACDSYITSLSYGDCGSRRNNGHLRVACNDRNNCHFLSLVTELASGVLTPQVDNTASGD